MTKEDLDKTYRKISIKALIIVLVVFFVCLSPIFIGGVFYVGYNLKYPHKEYYHESDSLKQDTSKHRKHRETFFEYDRRTRQENDNAYGFYPPIF